MTGIILTDKELQKTYDIYIKSGGNITATANELNIQRSTVQARLQRAKKRLNLEWDRPIVSGTLYGMQKEKRELPSKGRIKTYILTCAQNNTHVHTNFWTNLKAYAKYKHAELLVSQFSYNKSSYASSKSVKPGTGPTADDKADLWYDKALKGHFCNSRVELAPGLMFCGEVNILPTAERPLQGFETYTKKACGIFPHTTIALESIAGHVPGQTKINYSTGTVTVKNYIQRKAGLKAEFHHTYGALVVEVDAEGGYWVRQLNATGAGSFYDLDILVSDGEISIGNEIEAINWGDVHVENIDPKVLELNWGKNGILNTLKPKFQFMHDTVDFHARNHWRIKDAHAMFERWKMGVDDVRKEMERVADFLTSTAFRPWCKTVVVDSNHDNALERWLNEADYKADPINAIFFLETQLKKYCAMQMRDENFHLVEAVLRELGVKPVIKFLREDESFIICDDIETGMHGHLGPNGGKGGPLAYARMGRRTNTGHTHSAAILWGAYVAGTSSKLKLEYNKGPSSWTHSHILTYPNGKRCIITVRNNKWRG